MKNRLFMHFRSEDLNNLSNPLYFEEDAGACNMSLLAEQHVNNFFLKITPFLN